MATPKNVEAIYPLTPMQQGLLFHSLRGGADDEGVLGLRCDLEGALDPDRFRASWAEGLRRHPVLRSVLRWEGRDEPLQIVLRQVDVEVPTEDLRGLRPFEQQRRIEAAVAEGRERGLALDRAPTMRLALFQTGDAAWHLVWTCHHVLVDGWSGALVVGEVVALYNALARGEPAGLPPAPPFRDYVRWLREQSGPEAEAFWRAELAGVTGPTPLPFDPPSRGDEFTEGWERQEVTLPAGMSEALRATARRHRVTLGTVLQAAWALLLSRSSGHEDVVFDATASGRAVDLPGIETMAGMLITTLPVRVRVDDRATALDVVRQIHGAQAERSAHAFASPAQVHAWSDVPPHLRLSESLLVVENYPHGAADEGPLRVRSFASGVTSGYPLTVLVTPGDVVGLQLVYDASRFSADAMARLLYHAERLLERVAEDPDRPLAALLPEVAPAAGAAPPPPRGPRAADPEAYVAPQDDVERRLVALWERVLNVRPVGMEDEFFALGGQSVQAVQLLSRVERAFGTAPPMSVLFDGGTPARMAAALRTGAEVDRVWTSLVPIQPGGARAPLFCVHSYEGQVLLYRHLAEHLGPDQPVYGLEAVGLDGAEEPMADVHEMADRYVEEVRSVQPEGPYALLSICFGVAVALEMARRLTEAGEEVAALVVLDSSFDTYTNTPRDTTHPRPVRILKRLLRPQIVRELPMHLAIHGRKVVAAVQRVAITQKRTLQGPRHLRAWRTVEASQQAWAAYRPTPYPGPVTLFRSSAWTNRVAKQWHVPVWDELAGGGLTVHAVPGNHENMLTEPYVRTLAAQIRADLDRVADSSVDTVDPSAGPEAVVAS